MNAGQVIELQQYPTTNRKEENLFAEGRRKEVSEKNINNRLKNICSTSYMQ